jgi:dephospho-CoA kinase
LPACQLRHFFYSSYDRAYFVESRENVPRPQANRYLMLRVGLTGGIASGKSTVGHMFVELGCHLLDSDQLTHQLLEPGQGVHDAVVREFGRQILAQDGTINRRVLGDIVFKDPEARQKLNSLVHPAVIQRQKEWLEEMNEKDPGGIAIVDAALMIEVGTYKNYDKIVVVTCSPEIQKQRLLQRSGLTDEQIQARIQAQMPLTEKVKYADFVIDNSGVPANTRRQVEEVNSRLREFAANTSGRRHS